MHWPQSLSILPLVYLRTVNTQKAEKNRSDEDRNDISTNCARRQSSFPGCFRTRNGSHRLLLPGHVRSCRGRGSSGQGPPLWGPYTENDLFHDPLVSFGYIAGIKTRIELITGILVLPQRQTLLAARQTSDVDLLSNGRLRLGVGIGWNYVEYAALGQDFHVRGKRLEEQITLLWKLWSEPVVSFNGAFDKIDSMALNPRPNRAIPIYCGGISEPAYRRAARLADGFIFGGGPDRVLPAWRTLQSSLLEQGRDPVSFGADYQLPDGTTVAESLDLIRRWEDAGGTHCAVRTMKLGYQSHQQHIDHIAEIWARIA